MIPESFSLILFVCACTCVCLCGQESQCNKCVSLELYRRVRNFRGIQIFMDLVDIYPQQLNICTDVEVVWRLTSKPHKKFSAKIATFLQSAKLP